MYLRKSDRLEHGEALFIDAGAHKNLAGGHWVDRRDKINSDHGIRKSEKSDLGYTASFGGVGKGVEKTRTKVQVPTTIAGKLVISPPHILREVISQLFLECRL